MERASAAASRSAQNQAAKRWGQPTSDGEREVLSGWSRNGGGGGGGEMLYDDDDGEPSSLRDDDDEDDDDGLESAFDEYDFDADLSAVESAMDSESSVRDEADDGSEDATGGEWLFSPSLTADAYAFEPSSDGGVAALLGRWPGSFSGDSPEDEEDRKAPKATTGKGAKGKRENNEDPLDEFVQELWAAVQSKELDLEELKEVMKESELEGDIRPAQADEIMKRVTALAQLPTDSRDNNPGATRHAKNTQDAAAAKKLEDDSNLASGVHFGLKAQGGPALRRVPYDPACNQVGGYEEKVSGGYWVGIDILYDQALYVSSCAF